MHSPSSDSKSTSITCTVGDSNQITGLYSFKSLFKAGKDREKIKNLTSRPMFALRCCLCYLLFICMSPCLGHFYQQSRNVNHYEEGLLAYKKASELAEKDEHPHGCMVILEGQVTNITTVARFIPGHSSKKLFNEYSCGADE